MRFGQVFWFILQHSILAHTFRTETDRIDQLA